MATAARLGMSTSVTQPFTLPTTLITGGVYQTQLHIIRLYTATSSTDAALTSNITDGHLKSTLSGKISIVGTFRIRDTDSGTDSFTIRGGIYKGITSTQANRNYTALVTQSVNSVYEEAETGSNDDNYVDMYVKFSGVHVVADAEYYLGFVLESTSFTSSAPISIDYANITMELTDTIATI